ncbi:MAG TPA: DUF309 domain-containing protein [Verrucomicrobiales bacterium]|nr:DUF309 domain-containing protein [Verrucomicrobiales bacterium]
MESSAGGCWDAHYLGYFRCFNEGLYFEAHDVLEELWLRDRKGPNYAFHKGLIQLAGAFVHLQKERLRPAVALYDLADANFRRYPGRHDGIDLQSVREMAQRWRNAVAESGFSENPLKKWAAPRLELPANS